MSRNEIRRITCPQCGAESDFVVWSSVNTGMDPAQKEKVLDRSLFQFTCPECGEVATVDHSFLYHDVEQRLMLYMVKEEETFREAVDFFTSDLQVEEKDPEKALLARALNDAQKEYVQRIIFNINQLEEKIRVFDAGRDDRVIELLKVFFQNRIMSEQPQLGDVELYYADDEGKDVFVVIGMEGPLGSLEIPEELYQETVDNFGGQMADLRARQDLIVDEKWAMEVIKAVSAPGNRS